MINNSCISTDGGGIRGLILIQVLLNLERVTKQPIVKLFDWIAGTSTGGILALALLHGKYTASSRPLHRVVTCIFQKPNSQQFTAMEVTCTNH